MTSPRVAHTTDIHHPDEHKQAVRKAAGAGNSLAEYIRDAVEAEWLKDTGRE